MKTTRKERGAALVHNVQDIGNGEYIIKSASSSLLYYIEGEHCTCPDNHFKLEYCKHLWARDFYVSGL